MGSQDPNDQRPRDQEIEEQTPINQTKPPDQSTSSHLVYTYADETAAASPISAAVIPVNQDNAATREVALHSTYRQAKVSDKSIRNITTQSEVNTNDTTLDVNIERPPSTGNAEGEGDSQEVHTPVGIISSCSNTSDMQLGPGSPNTSDRVFPIRSVISVQASAQTGGSEPDYFAGPSKTSSAQRTSIADSATPISPTLSSPASQYVQPSRKNTLAGGISSVTADAVRRGKAEPISLFGTVASERSEGSVETNLTASHGKSALSEGMGEMYLTTRFNHVIIDGGHHVITGRSETLQHCEDEPIHTPGAIQGFGLLISLKETANGDLIVRHTSENSKRMIGYSPQELFRLRSFTDILTDEQADNLLDHIDFVKDEDSDPASDGPEVFSISIRPPHRKTVKLWAAIHINPAHPELIICEFEMDDDPNYPLRQEEDKISHAPYDTLNSNPTAEELVESTEILSKPLRVLRNARRRRGDAGAMQVFDIMSQVQEQLASANDLQVLLKILVGIVKELTGFHRVMIYQFDTYFNGKVVTELVDTTQTLDLYKGLNFPASDIPRQARELYKINKVRLLYDRGLETARIVCRSKEDLEVPLDMTHCYLRAMSPIHIKYLANMHVRSSMSLSINAFNELWGLIACHSYGSKGMRVAFPIRKMCRLIIDTASRNIERLSYASRLQARKLINTSPSEKNPTGYIIASSDDLLRLFDADCGILSIRGETKILGSIEHTQESLAMLEYLRLRKLTYVHASQDIRIDFPDLSYPPGFSFIAGILYVPLSAGGSDFIVFFRKGVIKEVKWAGNPYEKVIQEGTSSLLEPRKSFKLWRERVMGQSREWTEDQFETAAVLCLVYGKFIEVWRQKEAALQNSRLTRLLLANSAHEVRTPLNAIINYLEIALEGSLDQETRDNLARSHSASKSLIYVINDLLDLTKTEEGKALLKDEVFNLSACLREATGPFSVDAKRHSIKYDVIQHAGLPEEVLGDYRRVRQMVANLVSNAFQHSHANTITIEAYVMGVVDSIAKVEIVVDDNGCGMTAAQLDALFQQLEQVASLEDDDKQGSTKTESEIGEEPRNLGLGLAFVARLVRTMDGQLRLKSDVNKGSRFIVQLPFELPARPNKSVENDRNITAEKTIASVLSVPRQTRADGEVTLIDRMSSIGGDDAASVHSNYTTGSRSGQRSQSSSGADRLIAAISTPLSLGSPEPDTQAFQRTLRSASEGPPLEFSPPNKTGVEYVIDNRTPLRPIKVKDEYFSQPVASAPGDSPADPAATFNVPSIDLKLDPAMHRTSPNPSTITTTTKVTASDPIHLQVLVAEDDPINLKIIRKRLEKAGHHVYQAANGQECASAYEESRSSFDVILMDMQMPIVDGLSSTKIIREFEKSSPTTPLSPLALSHQRIPIIAVSASLVEHEKDIYINAGFDGWILKPIDFSRLSVLLSGLFDDSIRNSSLYIPGEWEKGGWFARRVKSNTISRSP